MPSPASFFRRTIVLYSFLRDTHRGLPPAEPAESATGPRSCDQGAILETGAARQRRELLGKVLVGGTFPDSRGELPD